jgi:Kyakuja-Dileera-Zisupton transposase
MSKSWNLSQNLLYSAKYGLVTVNEILDVFGVNQAVGYDIGCSHKVTVAASSISEKAWVLQFQLVVDVFHGHAHNHLCQLVNHPLFLTSFGLEDLATCERIFAGTNP